MSNNLESPLATLAHKINSAHDEAQAYAARAVERALAAGDLLLTVKARLNHGEFLPWCARNLPSIGRRTLQNYMRVARELPAEKRTDAHLTLNEALRLVAGEPESVEGMDSPEPRPPHQKSAPPEGIPATAGVMPIGQELADVLRQHAEFKAEAAEHTRKVRARLAAEHKVVTAPVAVQQQTAADPKNALEETERGKAITDIPQSLPDRTIDDLQEKTGLFEYLDSFIKQFAQKSKRHERYTRNIVNFWLVEWLEPWEETYKPEDWLFPDLDSIDNSIGSIQDWGKEPGEELNPLISNECDSIASSVDSLREELRRFLIVSRPDADDLEEAQS